MEEKKKKKTIKKKTRAKNIPKKSVVRVSKKTKKVKKTRKATVIFKAQIQPTTEVQAAVPTVTPIPPSSTSTESSIATPAAVQGLSYNRTKLWTAVAVTMIVIVVAWMYALPHNISVPSENATQLSQAADTSIGQMVSDIQQSWNTLTRQARTLDEITKNSNTSAPIQTNASNMNSAIPTNEELDNLFSDIN